jgi:hypothetical protein
MVTALHRAGVPAEHLADALTRAKVLPVDGTLTGLPTVTSAQGNDAPCRRHERV